MLTEVGQTEFGQNSCFLCFGRIWPRPTLAKVAVFLVASLLSLHWKKDMVSPSFPAVGVAALVEARVEAALQLCEDVSVVERLQASELLVGLSFCTGATSTTSELAHLVQDPRIVRETRFPRCHGLEQLRMAALPLQVQQGLMASLEVERRECLSLEHEPQRQSLAGVLAATNPTPKSEMVDEQQEVEPLRVADDRSQQPSS